MPPSAKKSSTITADDPHKGTSAPVLCAAVVSLHSFVVESVGTIALSDGGGLKRDARDLSGWDWVDVSVAVAIFGGRLFHERLFDHVVRHAEMDHMDDGI